MENEPLITAGASLSMLTPVTPDTSATVPTPCPAPQTAPQQEPAKLPDTVYVSFSAEVNAATTESLIAVMANCVTQKVETVYLLLSSPGGSVMHGINLYNMLRAMPFKLITHNVGNVDSIGNVIFLAGEQRFACPHSTFMFHGVGFDLDGKFRLEEKLLQEKLDSILHDHKRIGAVIQERTKLSELQTSELFHEAKTKDATFAISCGIVHEIKDVQIPAGASVIALVFKR